MYPWNSFDDAFRESKIRFQDVAMLDPESLPIPLTDEKNWRLCKRIHASSQVARLGDLADYAVTRGEINQTIYRMFIGSDPTKSRLLKGAEIGRYRLNEDLSQGEREWLDEARFVREHQPRQVIDRRRIATQRITGVDERLRLVGTIIEPPAYFADSTNSITVLDGSPYALEYLLGLINSTLFQWRFKITSTNNNVGTNELDSMPIRLIDFTDARDSAGHDRMVQMVGHMMDLQLELASTRIATAHAAIQRRIRTVDQRIDRLVYELYGLPAGDVSTVERLDGVGYTNSITPPSNTH